MKNFADGKQLKKIEKRLLKVVQKEWSGRADGMFVAVDKVDIFYCDENPSITLKLRYGKFIEATDPQDYHDLIDPYTGPYHIIPLLSIEQRLRTRNKLLNQDIIIDPIPEDILPVHNPYTGRYRVTPLAYVDQILRTVDKVMEEDLIVEKIPYQTTSNTAGGYTAVIG